MKEVISVMYSEEQILSRICEMAEQINKDLNGEPVRIVCTLKGAVMFATDLAKRLKGPAFFEFIIVSSYGSGTESSGNVVIKTDIDRPIDGENILIVEDIIDSGNTLNFLAENLKSRNAKTVRIATLLSKPSRRVVDVDVDYVGYVIPDEFVVGYGLDYDQKYRNLPYIGVLHFEED